MKKLILSILIASGSTCFAQVIGNEVYANANAYSYNNHNYSKSQFSATNVTTTDSTMIISTQVMMNKEADHYVLSVGVSQEAPSVKECNDKINSRITSFIQDLKQFDINESDIYIDFITQNKIYDYKIEGDIATQFLDGFEIKKNIIMEIKEVSKVDEIAALASQHKIYDIIKVDYIDKNIESTYEKLFKKAVEVITTKKELYEQVTMKKFNTNSRILSDHFEAVYPETQYKKYQAFETSNVKSNYNYNGKRFIEKNMKKSQTFYYDGVSTSAFDAVIHPVQTKVGIQYILELKIIYETDK